MSSSCGLISINEHENVPGFSVYPIPFHGSFSLSFENISGKEVIRVINLLGETVYEENIISEPGIKKQKHVNLNSSPGIYFVTIENDGKQFRQKIILE
jgi:hypothetical protein